MEMSCSFTSDEVKPNCIILDEIDGAMNGPEGRTAASTLLELSKSILRKKNSKEKSKGLVQIRPIICICNDLYAPVLRTIRKMAHIVYISEPHKARVVCRMRVRL